MSLFLMWSNLVFPLAPLNILISAEFSLLSSFFFTAQHSEPYFIAGVMIVLKTFSFNYTGIFLSHITPGYFLPLHPPDSNHVADISLWTSLTREQWPEIFEGCHCWQFSINNLYCGFCIICGARQVFCLCSADLQPMTLIHNSPFSRSSSTYSRVIVHSTRSSANIIAQGGPSICFPLERALL